MGSIRLSDSDGNTHVLEAIEGWRVMEGNPRAWFALHRRQRWRLRLATCHIHIAPQWAERLDPMRADEAARLDRVPDPQPTSRLCCQIIGRRSSMASNPA